MNKNKQLISWTRIEELTGEPIPTNINEEKYLLGTIISQNNTLDFCDRLKPHHFFVDEHKLIYTFIQQLRTEGRTIDIISLSQLNLKHKGPKILTPFYITQISNYCIFDITEITHIVHSLIECWIRRQMINMYFSTIKEFFNLSNDLYNVMDDNIKSIQKMQNVFDIKDSYNINEVIKERIKTISNLQKDKKDGKNVNIGIPFPFHRMNQKIGNMQPGDLIILAARPSMGKTALAECIAEYVANEICVTVDFYSKEMSKEQLADRYISRNTSIESKKIRSLELDLNDWKKIITDSFNDNSKLYIDDDDENDISEIIKKARKRKRENDTQLIIIDYLQLLKDSSSESNRDEEVSHISRKLKKLAKELKIPIIALCQLNRKVEERPNKEPKLSDLRESGSIEQDADLVMFIYRPSYYGITEDGGKNIEKIAQIIIAKHRNGSVGRVTLGFIEQFTKFTNIEDAISETNENPF